MGQTVRENRGELRADVARERVAHLDRWREGLVPLAQQRGQFFPGVLPAVGKQRHRRVRQLGQVIRAEDGRALGVDLLGGVAVRFPQVQNAHGGVVIVNQGGVGGQGDQRFEDVWNHRGHPRDQLPLGRLGQGLPRLHLEPGQPVVRHPGP